MGDFKNKVCDYSFDLSKPFTNHIEGTDIQLDSSLMHVSETP